MKSIKELSELRDRVAIDKKEMLFLLFFYIVNLFLRLYPKLEIDPHLLTFQADIWYRVAMSQHILDALHAGSFSLPEPDLRYLPYGKVPMWYPPLTPLFLALLSYISKADIPTICSRFIPFFEALAPISIYFLTKKIAGKEHGKLAAGISLISLSLTPSFIFWSGIADTQSFTVFMLPFYVLILIENSERRSFKKIALLGALLGFNFLFHLSYFAALLALLMTSLAIAIVERKHFILIDFGIAFAISQIIASPWWLPRNLYWWWIKALVTSSGLYTVKEQIKDYGYVAFVFGIFGFFYILNAFLRKEKNIKMKRNYLMLILWSTAFFLETQNERILFALNRIDLTWSTLAKPLEGFRFNIFLAQPISIAIGISLADIYRKIERKIERKENLKLNGILRKVFSALFLALIFLSFAYGVKDYSLDKKFQNSGITLAEYKAAEWFRSNAFEYEKKNERRARIIADYYREQMLSGLAPGRTLSGGEFPLRNVDFPYIKAPGIVQDDIYIIYRTESAENAWQIMRKYNATHVFYSENMEKYGNVVSRLKQGFGIDVNLEKFFDDRYFKLVYRDDKNKIMIFEAVYEKE